MHARISAAALGAAALLALAGCGGSSSSSGTTTASAATAKLIGLAIADGKVNGDGPVRVTVARGTDLTLQVSADVSDEVHIHGYDLHAEVAPGKPATIGFTASVPGRFEAELESRSQQILQLTVDP